MVSTLVRPVQSALTAPSLSASAIEAIQFLSLSNLSADQQIIVETAIGQVALQRNCSRLTAAYWLNSKAFPELF
ncbi:hypothetical protein H6G89_31835 [Oscillatoria sp. FACHB-1407]|uniref:hypothetical protein n=1 Tax=Oscillatoria sp. FACHB-1407 TaxID=2692847 RepID=UPI0016876DA1|nr:hypothetical protein [Oscillatoria sp. FACHB-1407]MBD2465586.1 hypothetical protein [Oscillatoria sp. FACHB-1407]